MDTRLNIEIKTNGFKEALNGLKELNAISKEFQKSVKDLNLNIKVKKPDLNGINSDIKRLNATLMKFNSSALISVKFNKNSAKEINAYLREVDKTINNAKKSAIINLSVRNIGLDSTLSKLREMVNLCKQIPRNAFKIDIKTPSDSITRLRNIRKEIALIPTSKSANIRLNVNDSIQKAKELRKEFTLLDAFKFTGLIVGLNELKDAFLGFTQITSNMQNITSRLDLQTRDTEISTAIFQKLSDIAFETHQNVEVMGRSFLTLNPILKESGYSINETLGVVSTFNKILALSKPSLSEAQSAILQFKQALASNNFAGDEFKSLSENLPMLPTLLSKNLGVTIGELKKMSSEGKLTADTIINAFKKMDAELSSDMKNLSKSPEQALCDLQNAFMLSIDKINKELGFTEGLAKGMDNFRDFFFGTDEIFTKLSLKVLSTAGIVKDGILLVEQSMMSMVIHFANLVMQIASKAKDAVLSLLNGVIKVYNTHFNTIENGVNKISGFFGGGKVLNLDFFKIKEISSEGFDKAKKTIEDYTAAINQNVFDTTESINKHWDRIFGDDKPQTNLKKTQNEITKTLNETKKITSKMGEYRKYKEIDLKYGEGTSRKLKLIENQRDKAIKEYARTKEEQLEIEKDFQVKIDKLLENKNEGRKKGKKGKNSNKPQIENQGLQIPKINTGKIRSGISRANKEITNTIKSWEDRKKELLKDNDDFKLSELTKAYEQDLKNYGANIEAKKIIDDHYKKERLKLENEINETKKRNMQEAFNIENQTNENILKVKQNVLKGILDDKERELELAKAQNEYDLKSISLMQKNGLINAEEAKGMIAGANNALNEVMLNTNKWYQGLNEGFSSLGNTMSDFFNISSEGFMNFEKLGLEVIQNLANSMIKNLVLNPFIDMINNSFKGFFSTTPSVSGFSAPAVNAYSIDQLISTYGITPYSTPNSTNSNSNSGVGVLKVEIINNSGIPLEVSSAKYNNERGAIEAEIRSVVNKMKDEGEL